MAGAMRKMAVYLGLVEDDGYDGRGFDPDDDFEPELDPEPERDHRRHEPAHQSHGSHQPQRDEEVRVVQPPAQREPMPRSASLAAESSRPARI
ncbi:cell division protein SepF, partial [Streptomyces ardesiacus]